MNKQIEALKLALEALEAHADIGIKSDKAITAIREALAERFCDNNCTWLDHHPECDKAEQPTQQEPLTDAQIGAVAADIWGSVLIAPQSYQAFARAIEAKLKEKNNG